MADGINNNSSALDKNHEDKTHKDNSMAIIMYWRGKERTTVIHNFEEISKDPIACHQILERLMERCSSDDPLS
jgi:hypothetical protein